MKLFFIRHGQTDWNTEGRIQGSYDSELNQTGIIQAEELGSKILKSDYKFSKIYTSQQKRAIKTAEILSKAINIDYIPVEGLQEMNLGEWEGLSWPEVQEKFPMEYGEWFNNRRYTKTPRGESYIVADADGNQTGVCGVIDLRDEKKAEKNFLNYTLTRQSNKYTIN